MNRRILFLFLIATLGFNACSEKCAEPDIQAINGLYFELQQDGENGFTTEELNQIYFVRFIPSSEPLIADTFYTQGNYPLGLGKFVINDTYPFRNDQSPYYTIYGYQVVDPVTSFAANIENIDLGGQYDGDCGYDNTLKTYTLNGDSVDMSGSMAYYPITQ